MKPADATGFVIKICCIQSREEACAAIEAGASALGFVTEMPSGPGILSEEKIASLISEFGELTMPVLLTSRSDAAGILAQMSVTGARVVQLCRPVSKNICAEIRHHFPAVTLIQVVHVLGNAAYEMAQAAWELADALLLDSGNPGLETPLLGGTGQTHNWEISQAICNMSPVPVILAGGLNASNVSDAIRNVRPSGVDVCTGVRTNGRLDRRKTEAFIQNARRALEQIS